MTTAETSAGGACIPVEWVRVGTGALGERRPVDGLEGLGAGSGDAAGPDTERAPDVEGDDGERGGNISVLLISVVIGSFAGKP